MGEARQTILVKSSQMQRINHSFQGDQVMDTVKLSDFSGQLQYEPVYLMQ